MTAYKIEDGNVCKIETVGKTVIKCYLGSVDNCIIEYNSDGTIKEAIIKPQEILKPQPQNEITMEDKVDYLFLKANGVI